MKLSKVFTYKTVENRNVVAEETMGYGAAMLQRHRTDDLTPDVVDRLRAMSVLEVIN